MEEKHYLVGPRYRLEGILVDLSKRNKDKNTLVELGKIVVIDIADIADDIEIKKIKKQTINRSPGKSEIRWDKCTEAKKY